MRKSILLPAAAATIALFAAAAPKKPAPSDLSLTTIKGEKTRLRDYRGKIVVVNFWATWCPPCREEMPMLVAAEKDWGPKGVVFIGASLDDSHTRQTIPAFLNTFNVAFPVWTGATSDDLARLKLGNAVPATAFFDDEGVVFARVKGEIHRPEIDERLAWATGDRAKPQPEALVTHLDQ